MLATLAMLGNDTTPAGPSNPSTATKTASPNSFIFTSPSLPSSFSWTRHVYAGADVRVVVEASHFDVHSQVLALYSEYFRALFNGPWTPKKTDDGLLRLVEPGDIVTAREFNILLDFIYLPAEGKQLMLSATNVVEAEVVAAALQVPALTLAVKAHFARNPNIANWKNVQMLLEKATERQPSLELVRAHCAQFLSSEQGGHWIRVWYLAEKYDLTSLLNEKHYGNLPHDPWNDPFFAKLSDSLRSTLLLARVQNMWVASKDPHGAPSIPFKLGQNTPSPNGSGYHNIKHMDLMSVHAPDALTTRDIAATVVKSFPLPGSSHEGPQVRKDARFTPAARFM